MLRIYPKSRIAEITAPPPAFLRRILTKPLRQARKLRPTTPPDPARLWILIHRGRIKPFSHQKDIHFTAEPLLVGPTETEASALLGPVESTTYVTVKSYDGHVTYQNLHTKTSWRRRGISSTILLRLQAHLRHEGDPSLQGTFTHPGWHAAKHMQKHYNWDIIGRAPTDLPLPPLPS